ncbi:MAG TPA: hypothetical protein VGJ44_00515, partial [Kribbellaceae bacterium]
MTVPHTVVHDFATTWTSTDPARLSTGTVDGGMQLTATPGATGVEARFTPATPFDLRDRDELRFWTRADQVADGAAARPFRLELTYLDAGDTAGEEHRWYVPVNRAGVWEQHRIGLADDRRAEITQFALRCATGRPVRMVLADLLAVAEEPLRDVEAALVEALEAAAVLPSVPAQPAAAGATAITIGLNRRFRARNRLVVSADLQTPYEVTAVSHDTGAGTSTLTVTPALGAALTADGTVAVRAPVVAEESPLLPPADPADLPDPVLLLALTDQREEPERGWNVPQRDSFRPRAGLIACSLRPPTRPVLAEYQIIAAAGDRADSLALRGAVLVRLGIDTGIRVNGAVLGVRPLLPPPLTERDRAVLAPVYVHVATRV